MTDELEGAVERSRLLHPSRPAGQRCSSRYTVQGQVLECELVAHTHMQIGRLDFTRHLAQWMGRDVGWSTRTADRL